MRNTASQLLDSIGRPMPQQLDLFGAVLSSYLDGDEHTNDALYESLAQGGHLSHADLQAREPVGRMERATALQRCGCAGISKRSNASAYWSVSLARAVPGELQSATRTT